MLKKPDRLRTTPPNLDFLNVENTTLVSTVSTEYLQAPNTQSVMLSDCQVVLDDFFFFKNPTAKFKMLESNEDKTHSVSSHQVLDKQYLDQIE